MGEVRVVAAHRSARLTARPDSRQDSPLQPVASGSAVGWPCRHSYAPSDISTTSWGYASRTPARRRRWPAVQVGGRGVNGTVTAAPVAGSSRTETRRAPVVGGVELHGRGSAGVEPPGGFAGFQARQGLPPVLQVFGEEGHREGRAEVLAARHDDLGVEEVVTGQDAGLSTGQDAYRDASAAVVGQVDQVEHGGIMPGPETPPPTASGGTDAVGRGGGGVRPPGGPGHPGSRPGTPRSRGSVRAACTRR
ncbi:hypothetical protein STREPTOSP366_29590 [Streptomyces variabilis]